MSRKSHKGDNREYRRIKRELSVYKSVEKKVFIFVLYYYYGISRQNILKIMNMNKNAYTNLNRHIEEAPYEIAHNENAKKIFIKLCTN